MTPTRARAPRLSLLSVTAAVAALLAAATFGPSAHAQVALPFRISGAGLAPQGLPLPGQPPRSHSAIGSASYLGRYHGEGKVQTLTAGNPDANGVIAGTFGSGVPFRFDFGNGNVLVCDYGRVPGNPGTFTLTPTPDGRYVAHWVAIFAPNPRLSTGRFHGVTGSWLMIADSAPLIPGVTEPGAYSWVGEGTLFLPRGK